jgi:hypothetical protein
MLLIKAFSSPAPASATYRHGDDYFLDCDEAWLHEDALEQDGGQTCNDTELINKSAKVCHLAQRSSSGSSSPRLQEIVLRAGRD